MDPQSSESNVPAIVRQIGNRPISRRKVLKVSALGIAASTLGVLETLSLVPKRMAYATPLNLPDIQFDISDYIGPVTTINDVLVRFGPVHTLFLTAQLTRNPDPRKDQQLLSDALNTIEAIYSFRPGGVFTFVSYGLPYFARLPQGLVSSAMPRLLSDNTRFALEEAMPGPTDVSPVNPGITKQTFNVPVVIEKNDILFTLRSDSLKNLNSVSAWLQGSDNLNGQKVKSPGFAGLFKFTSSRLMFVQIGLPRQIADSHNLPFAGRVNPHSPMWMGFGDQQVNASGPAEITTFQGNVSASFTNTKSGDYFFNGSIQHLSHVIQDLNQFYANEEPYTERCQYMFRSDPIPSTGYKDQYANGGGPAFLNNVFQGANDALANAEAINTYQHEHRMGHLAALQRSSRAADGTPIHIRMDGPGFDSLDVPDGSNQPKLQFTIFVPTADFFSRLRKNQAALDLVQAHGVQSDDNGLERFITATRRQNFLVPPRAHRAFPLLEFINR